jgi:hypothetical protein
MSDEKEKGCPEGMVKKKGKCVLPDVTFTSFFMALNTSALFHLGEISDPATGKPQKDIAMAKHTIDTMLLLQKKTAGNLTDEEKDLVETSLYDLQMRFVKANRQ